MGNFLNFMDGPLNVSSFIRNLVIAGITKEDFNQFNEKIVKMGPEELMQTAQKYLNRKSMAEVIVLPEQNLE
jgi:predicted Zn-dependent peptidase